MSLLRVEAREAITKERADDPGYAVLAVCDVAKSFQIPREQVHTLKEKALHPFRSAGHDEFRALRGVSFDVAPGEFFGIVGRNGSGKSTLLKCMAGIYGVDRGRIFVDGRLSTFIELGVGFNMDLAAYDNVMLNATMLGLSPKEARRRFDRIIDFAELHDFTDLKIKNYSSGMLVRLAFSVMIQVDADILLIDEVLAVGDAAFQQKCFDEFGRIRRSGATVVLVTHDMGAVQRFCDRAMLLERGAVATIGAVEQVAARYMEMNFSGRARAAVQDEVAAPAQPAEPAPGDEVRIGDRVAEIVDAWVEDDNGARTDVLVVGARCTMAFRCRVDGLVENPMLGMSLIDSQGVTVFTANNNYDREAAGVYEAGDQFVVRITFQNHLAPDRYHITAAIGRDTNGLAWHDRRERMCSVTVTGTRPRLATVQFPYEMRVDRAAERERP